MADAVVPDRPGYWWLRRDDGRRHIALVTPDVPPGAGHWVASIPGVGIAFTLVAVHGFRWLGPVDPCQVPDSDGDDDALRPDQLW